MKTVGIGDILYCTIREEILLVTDLGKDQFGQNAIACAKKESDMKRDTKYIYTAGLVFKHMIKLGKV